MSVNPQNAQNASTASFTTALSVNAVVAGAELVGFILIRRLVKALYEPRTYIPPRARQARVLGTHLLWPLWKIAWADPKEILDKNGVDPYVFVRFLNMMAKALVPIWLISWLVLLPLNSAQPNKGLDGLDRLTLGNIDEGRQVRNWAHLVLDYIFIFWIMYLIWKEMDHWLAIRQKHLISPSHARLPQASTVMITGIPMEYMDEQQLEGLFTHLPGGVKRIWLARDLKEMPDLYDRRKTACNKLESAEVNLIKLARKLKSDNEAKIAKLEAKGKPVPEDLRASVERPVQPARSPSAEEEEEGEKPMSLADQLVPPSKRPFFRQKPRWAPFGLGFLGIGTKIDTIEWARKEIAFCNQGLKKGREQLDKDVSNEGSDQDYYPPLGAAFVHFEKQIAAHMAMQCLAHHTPYRMADRYIEQAPENVIWQNLALNPYDATVRKAISYAITGGMIVLWTFPVAFIGALSNISTLTETYPWLSWLNFLSREGFAYRLLEGVVTGLLPPILLALLMLALPAILRQLGRFQGIPSKTAVELDVMNRYFVFLVIHTFFVVTLTRGLLKSIGPLLENPTSVANILATQMPTASTFFITLILTQFTGTAGTLLQPISLAFYYIRIILQGGSPRSIYNTRYRLQTTQWGTTFPGVTVYAVITIAYMVISPVINGFGALFFVLSSIVYKYLFIWVYDEPVSQDTGGRFFPKAINHVFVGMYVQEICLCTLFFLARDDDGPSSIPQAALMIVLIVITAGFHYVMNHSYNPLLDALPLSLSHLHAQTDAQIEAELNAKGDLRPNLANKIAKTGEKVLSPITAPAKGQTDKVFSKGKLVFAQIKTTPDERRAQRSRAATLDTAGVNAHSNAPMTKKMRTGPTNQPLAMPTAPGPPAGLTSSDPNTAGYKVDAEQLEREQAQQDEMDREEELSHQRATTRESDDTLLPTHTDEKVAGSSKAKRHNEDANADDGSDDDVNDNDHHPISRGRHDQKHPLRRSADTSPTSPQDTFPPYPSNTHQTDADAEAQTQTQTDDEENYFAKPGGSGVINTDEIDGNDSNAFFHPASKEPQMILWLPRDELGLCVAEIEANTALGVKSSCRRAKLDGRGKVKITGPPPKH